MKDTPHITKTTVVAKTEFFRVESVNLQFSNGNKRTFERLGVFDSKIKAVMVVPVTQDRQFIMVKEYAVGTQSYEISFPKGKVDLNETVEQGALRELKEEVGYGSNQMYHIMNFALSPHYMCHKMGLYMARNLYEERLLGDEPEPLEVLYLTFEEAQCLVEQEKLIDVKTIAALYLANQFLSKL